MKVPQWVTIKGSHYDSPVNLRFYVTILVKVRSSMSREVDYTPDAGHRIYRLSELDVWQHKSLWEKQQK